MNPPWQGKICVLAKEFMLNVQYSSAEVSFVRELRAYGHLKWVVRSGAGGCANVVLGVDVR
jgi:hypothetical protein